jgi:seryl-tRNA synthetase
VLDLRAIRRDPEPVRAALARRGDGSDARLDTALALDERRRALLPEVEGLRARQNEASQGIARAKKAGEDASEAIAAMQEVSRRAKALGEELAGVESELETAVDHHPRSTEDAPQKVLVPESQLEAAQHAIESMTDPDDLIADA